MVGTWLIDDQECPCQFEPVEMIGIIGIIKIVAIMNDFNQCKPEILLYWWHVVLFSLRTPSPLELLQEPVRARARALVTGGGGAGDVGHCCGVRPIVPIRHGGVLSNDKGMLEPRNKHYDSIAQVKPAGFKSLLSILHEHPQEFSFSLNASTRQCFCLRIWHTCLLARVCKRVVTLCSGY